MKVMRIRTHYGVPALKGENNWGANDPGTALSMIKCGHFVVSKYDKHVLLPGASIVSADVEPDEAEEPAPRGPGRPKKEAA